MWGVPMREDLIGALLEGMGYAEQNSIVQAAFYSMLKNTSDMVFLKNADLVYVAASMSFVKMVGKSAVSEIIGRTDLEIFEDKSLARKYVSDDHILLEKGEDLIDYIEPITDEDGKHRYGTTSKYILHDIDGKVLGILGFTRDITRDYLARQHYQQELKFLFELPEETYAVSYIDVDNWRVVSQRRQCIGGCTLQSCFTVEELRIAAVESIVDNGCSAAEFYRNFSPEVLKVIYISGRRRMSFKYQRHMSNGEVRWVQNDIRLLTDVDTGHLCAMLSAKDIDAKKREEHDLVVAAKLDRMTMLLNRETTMESIRQIIDDDPTGMHALYMIDVDNFKALNDTKGHQMGDEFLVELAREIKKHFRETDVVGRIGGDEFFALMRGIPGKAEAAKKAQELLNALQLVCADYVGVKLSASIGISLYPDNASTMEELYAKADDALYQAKRKGKNQFVFISD